MGPGQSSDDVMRFAFRGEIWTWRGPAPWFFVTVPDEISAELAAASAIVSYGWGMIPVSVVLGRSRWATSLWPKDEAYVLPLKAAVRRAERIDEGDQVDVELIVEITSR